MTSRLGLGSGQGSGSSQTRLPWHLDIFWLRDESMEDSASLPPPDVIAEEILEDLRAALEQLEEIAGDLAQEPAQRRAMA